MPNEESAHEYPTLEAFYAARPERETSPEVDFGVMWADDGGWPHYRVSWVEATGEFYAIRQAKPSTVELLAGGIPTRAQADHVMDGWAEIEPQRLDWVRSRLHLRSPEREAAKNYELRGRVLLLEDSANLADSVARALQARGYAVDWAATVAEAKAIYEVDRYDVLLCDYDVPDGTGLEFLASVRGSDKAVTILWSGLDRTLEATASGLHIDHVCLKKNDIGDVLDLLDASVKT